MVSMLIVGAIHELPDFEFILVIEGRFVNRPY